MPDLTAEPRHQSGGLAVALAKLNLDALTVADAVADVAATAGENVTTAIRADLKEFKAETRHAFCPKSTPALPKSAQTLRNWLARSNRSTARSPRSAG